MNRSIHPHHGEGPSFPRITGEITSPAERQEYKNKKSGGVRKVL